MKAKIVKELGSGTTSKVFLVTVENKNEFAIAKAFRLKYLDAAKREYDLLKSLVHPNIIKTLGFQESEEHKGKFSILFLEFGRFDLYNEFGQSNVATYRLRTDAILTTMKQILSAVEYLHSQGIVHRDIKLSNLISMKEDSVGDEIKLIDFGMAHRISEPLRNKCCGTLPYLPPNPTQFTKDWKIDTPLTTEQFTILKQFDVYALGILFYYLCAGQMPFPPDLVTLVTLTEFMKQGPEQFKLSGSEIPRFEPLINSMICFDISKIPSIAIIGETFNNLLI